MAVNEFPQRRQNTDTTEPRTELMGWDKKQSLRKMDQRQKEHNMVYLGP